MTSSWECHACNYENDETIRTCKICRTPQRPSAYIKSRSIEIEYCLDSILEEKENYDKGECIDLQEFKLNDLWVWFSFYPRGDMKSSNGYCSGYIFLEHEDNHKMTFDKREVTGVVSCGNIKKSINDIAREFEEGLGRTNLFLFETIQENRTLSIKITIGDDQHRVCYEKENNIYKRNMELLYEKSKLEGDITIVANDSETVLHMMNYNNTQGNGNVEIQNDRCDKKQCMIINNQNPGIKQKSNELISDLFNRPSKIVNRTCNTSNVNQNPHKITNNKLLMNLVSDVSAQSSVSPSNIKSLKTSVSSVIPSSAFANANTNVNENTVHGQFSNDIENLFNHNSESCDDIKGIDEDDDDDSQYEHDMYPKTYYVNKSMNNSRPSNSSSPPTTATAVNHAHHHFCTSSMPSRMKSVSVSHKRRKRKNEIRVNSLILRSASKVFDNILSQNMQEKNSKIIEIQCKSVKDLDDMIYFMIVNKLRDDCNALNVIRLAHYFQLQHLFNECLNRIVNDISIDNFVDTILIFERYNVVHGYMTLVEFGKQHLHQIKLEKNFNQLPFSFRFGILGSNNIQHPNNSV